MLLFIAQNTKKVNKKRELSLRVLNYTHIIAQNVTQVKWFFENKVNFIF